MCKTLGIFGVTYVLGLGVTVLNNMGRFTAVQLVHVCLTIRALIFAVVGTQMYHMEMRDKMMETMNKNWGPFYRKECWPFYARAINATARDREQRHSFTFADYVSATGKIR